MDGFQERELRRLHRGTSSTLLFQPLLTHYQAITISATELDAVAKWQGLNTASFTKPGDFLIVRTGFTKQYLALSPHEQAILPYREDADAQWIGVEASDATLRWLWEKKLSLVGSDNPAFESVPFNGTIGGVPRALHQVFIGGWGQSIGELIFFPLVMRD
jgi:kynurenine formamidase